MVRRKSLVSLFPLDVNLDLLICLCDRDTSNQPSQVTNPTGTLLLGFSNADGSGGENLDISQFLTRTRVLFSFLIRRVTGTLFR